MAVVLRRYWWVGLAVLALLILKAFMVAGMAHDKARGDAATAAGIPEERVEIRDGLDVHMTGFTTEAERDAAIEAVDELPSSWDVTGELIAEPEPAADEPEEEPAAPTTSAPEPEPVPAADPAEIQALVSPEGIVLTGVVASDEIRQLVVMAAEDRFGADRVDDQMTVDPEEAGTDGGTLIVTGEATTERQREGWLADASTVASQVGLEVDDQITMADVAGQLNALFELEPIEFDRARATIRPSSRMVLDQAAELINANAGIRLNVVGHTDTDGSDEANQALSQARAEAVVAYLVDQGDVSPDRLEAEGRGESELLVEPEATADDRQRNRRIEWEVLS